MSVRSGKKKLNGGVVFVDIDVRRAIQRFAAGSALLLLSGACAATALCFPHSTAWFVIVMLSGVVVAAAGAASISILRESWLPVALAVLGLLSGFVSVFFVVPFLQVQGRPARVSSLEEIRQSAAEMFVIENLSVRLDLAGRAPVFVEAEDSSYPDGHVIAAPLVHHAWTRDQATEVWALYRNDPDPTASSGVRLSPLDFSFEEFMSARAQSERLHSVRSSPGAIFILIVPSLDSEIASRRNAATVAVAILLLLYACAVLAAERSAIP
jgi:hypothetical protein